MAFQFSIKISCIMSFFVIFTLLTTLHFSFVASEQEINNLLYFNLASAVPAPADSIQTCSTPSQLYQATFSGRVSCKTACNEGTWEFQWQTTDAETIDGLTLKPISVSFYFYQLATGTILYRRQEEIRPTDGTTMTTVEFAFPKEGDLSPPVPKIVGDFGFYGDLYYCFSKAGRADAVYIPTTLTTVLNKFSPDPETSQLSNTFQFYQYLAPYLCDAALATIATFEVDSKYSYSDVSWYLIGYRLVYPPQAVIAINMALIGPVEFIHRQQEELPPPADRCAPPASEDTPLIPESEKPIPIWCFLNSNRFAACLHPNHRQVNFQFDNTLISSQDQTFNDIVSKTFYENSYIQFDCSSIGISAKLTSAKLNQKVYLQLEYTTANSTDTLDKPQPFLIQIDPFSTAKAYQLLPTSNPLQSTFQTVGSTEQKLFNRHFLSQQNKSLKIQDPDTHVFDSNTPPSMFDASTFSTDGVISCMWTLKYPSRIKADRFFHSAHIEFTGLIYFTNKANATTVSIHTRVHGAQVTPLKQAPITQTSPITGYEHKLGPSLTQNVPIYSMISGFRAGFYLATATTFDFDFDLLMFDKDLEKDDPQSVDIVAFIPFAPGSPTGQPVQCSLVITKEMCSNEIDAEYAQCVQQFNDIYVTPKYTLNEDQPSTMASQTITTSKDHSGMIKRVHKAIPRGNPLSKKNIHSINSKHHKILHPKLPPTQLPQIRQAETKSNRSLIFDAAQTTVHNTIDTPANAFIFAQNQNFYNATSIVLPREDYDLDMKYFRMDINFATQEAKKVEEYFEVIIFQFPMRYWEFVELPRHAPFDETSTSPDPEPLCRYYNGEKKYSVEIPTNQVTVTMKTHRILLYGWATVEIHWPLRIQCERIIFARVNTKTVNCNFNPGSQNCYPPWQSKFTTRTGPDGWKSPEERESPLQDQLLTEYGSTQKRYSHLYRSRSQALPSTTATTTQKISTDSLPDSSIMSYAQIKWCLVGIVESLLEISATAVNYSFGDEYQALPLQFPWRNDKGDLFELNSLDDFTTFATKSLAPSKPSITTFSDFINDLYSTFALLFTDVLNHPQVEVQSSLPNPIQMIDYSTLSSLEPFIQKPSPHMLSQHTLINQQSPARNNDEIELIEYFNAENGHHITNLPHHQRLQSLYFGKSKSLRYQREQLMQQYSRNFSPLFEMSPSDPPVSFSDISSQHNSLSTPLYRPSNPFRQFHPSQHGNDDDDDDDDDGFEKSPWFNLTEYFQASNRDSEKTIISAEFKLVQLDPTQRPPSIRISGNFFRLWAQNVPHPISPLVIYLLIAAAVVIAILIALLIFHKFEVISRCATRTAKMAQKRPKKPLTEQEVDEKYMEEYPIGYSCEELY